MERWIKEMEKPFIACGFPMDKRMDWEIYYLRGRVDAWWRCFQYRGRETMGWGSFLEELCAYFYPIHLCMKKNDKFMSLGQGDMLIEKYYTRFINLVQFSPNVEANEAIQVHCFNISLGIIY